MKKLIFTLALCAMFLAGCGQNTAKDPAVGQSYALGTICTQTIYAGDETVIAEADQLLFDIDARMSLFREQSEVDKINESGDFVEVSEDTYAVIELAQSISAATDGAFDISMGILTQEWDITNNPHVPEDAIIKEELKQVGYEAIELKDGKVKTPAPMKIDLGGIAKGFAADEIAKLYREKGVTSATINLGGNIYAVGQKPDGSAFRIGIADPENSADYFAIVSLPDRTALVTSGAYERNFTENGVFYHHILDPKTGYPSNSDIKSVSIFAESSARADALSTAVFVLGSEKGMDVLNAMEGIEAIIVTQDNQVILTDGVIEKYEFTITNQKYAIK